MVLGGLGPVRCQRLEAASVSGERGKLVADLRRAVLDLDVDAYGKALLHTLVQYVDDAGWCYPAMARIAREAGMSERKARIVVRDLEDRGALEVARSTGRAANRYRLRPGTVCSVQPGTACSVQHDQPGTGLGVNPVHGAGFEAANPAPQVSQPGTVGIPTRHAVPPIGMNGSNGSSSSQGGEPREDCDAIDLPDDTAPPGRDATPEPTPNPGTRPRELQDVWSSADPPWFESGDDPFEIGTAY